MFINIHFIWKRWVSTFFKLTLKSQSSYLYNYPRIAKLTLAIQCGHERKNVFEQ